ncbi:Uncharacterized protein TPS_09335 [Trichinella pseudospiralis]
MSVNNRLKCSAVFTHLWMAFADKDLFHRVEEIEQRFDQIEVILRNIQLIYSKVLFEIVLLTNSDLLLLLTDNETANTGSVA